ncbi:nuclear transport factor 2 family protein [Thioalkalivibrio sp. XN279]|uniref:nuclear transport factor 2 family protein n=1 Tax=Thioalkalivibrio sp. XN279 TaxID=2714953 RepID=UPI00140C117D|nr:nuclear transport factor 2 family protein [Thioalkalivibrio sp. XN279]NHA14714.1 hypothetical protein [Thioalkalivibrio sp. XN279]
MKSLLRGFGLLLLCLATAGCAMSSACGPAPYMDARARPSLAIPEGLDAPDRRAALRVPAAGEVGGRLANDPGNCIINPPPFYAESSSARAEGSAAAARAVAGPGGAATGVAGFVEQWAALWSGRDADGWLGLYASDYAPQGYGAPEEWRAEQRGRFQVPASTRVDLDTLEVEETADGIVRARFVQRFGQPPEERAVRKELVLLPLSNGAWRIVDERILAIL